MVSLTRASAIAEEVSQQEKLPQQEQIQELLCKSPFASLRNVICEVHGNAMVLRGHVESFYMKQLAQETIRKLDPKHVIVNMLTVE